MRLAEKALLLATRNRLRMPINQAAHSQGGAGFKDHECEVEFDEMTPNTVGTRYAAVMPGGFRPGPCHNTSGGVNDLVYGVDVLVLIRAGNVANDRLRNLFLNNVGALEEQIDKLFPAIDFNENLRNDANTIIQAEGGSTEGFIENLRFVGADARPRMAPAELFAGTPGTAAGLMRVIHFHGARRITTKA